MRISDFLITSLSYILKPSKRKLIEYCKVFKSKNGLEIGGPSPLFSLKGYFPVYLFANKIDGVNFSNETIWEGSIKEGNNYKYYTKTGYQYIREATNLYDIPSEKFDFILSCHNLEHVANPLKAIEEWKRVLKPGGFLVLVLPDKRYTFDVNRAYTTMEHLLDDYKKNVNEDDNTHFDEVIQTQPKSISEEELTILKEKINQNLTYRHVHHHVFSFELIDEMFQFFSFKKIYQQEASNFHLISIAQKQ